MVCGASDSGFGTRVGTPARGTGRRVVCSASGSEFGDRGSGLARGSGGCAGLRREQLWVWRAGRDPRSGTGRRPVCSASGSGFGARDLGLDSTDHLKHIVRKQVCGYLLPTHAPSVTLGNMTTGKADPATVA